MRTRWISRVLLVSLLAPALLNAQAVVYKTKTFEKTTGDVSLNVSYPEIQSTQPPSLKPKLAEIIMNWILAVPVGDDSSPARTVDEIYTRFRAEHQRFSKEFGTSVPWEYSREVEIVYQSRRVVCLQLHEDGYTGGAHPFGETRYVNLRPDTGQKMTLRDLIKEGEEANLTRIAEKQLRETYQITPGKPLTDADFFVEQLQLTDNFAITQSGITFFYNEEISPHSMGPVFIELPYSTIHDLLKTDLELPAR
jgi:hypothetical protein